MSYNILSLASLVLGLVGLFTAGSIWCIPICIASLVLGIIALTDYLAYKWPSICGMILAIGGCLIISYQLFYPYIVLYELSKGVEEVATVAEASDGSHQATKNVSPISSPVKNGGQKVRTQSSTQVIDTNPVEKSVTVNTTPNDGKYRIGDTWEVAGQWRLTITGVTESFERNEYSDKNPVAVYIVSFKSENIGFKEEYSDGLWFVLNDNIVDSNGEMGYDYPISVTNYQQETPVGAHCNAECVVAVEHRGSFTLNITKYDGNDVRQTAQFFIETQ